MLIRSECPKNVSFNFEDEITECCAAGEGAGAFDDGDSGLRGILEIGRSPQSSTSAGLLDGIASPPTSLSHSRNRISNGNSAGMSAPVYTRSTLSGVESVPPTNVAV